ncbi:protein arginine N-methyltransferase 1 [Plakobranchus ocellatus]|uniref:type I protein arginine methyltransferase n=1 Tax=Plakobranchus ocellatus TaxID=259542 RepID=A0AAV4ATP9_9GAST|nr:protein arginine N-methyltransferase 1 [Plakobranchus ocellatus]
MAAATRQQKDTSAQPLPSESHADGNASDYFISYNDLDIHRLMLKDRPRTLAYRNFFEANRELVKDKVVLDVGAGTGILSLFAAIAGAKKVYAVEASDVASLCKEIVEENELDKIIEVIHGTVEDIHLDTKVDLIVSEWMGFYLLHESMLDSVIVARDRFLSPGGIMAPSHAVIYFAPVDMSKHFQDRADEWSNIYGFDFSPVASAINRQEVGQPLVECLSPDVLRSEPKELLSLDLKTVTKEDVRKFTVGLEFHIPQETKIHGFACWFDVIFSGGAVSGGKGSPGGVTGGPQIVHVDEKGDARCQDSPSSSLDTTENSTPPIGANSPAAPGVVLLKTGPRDSPTHWKQTVIFLPHTIAVGSGTDLCCHVTMAQDTQINKRHYNITVALTDSADLEEEEEEGDSEEEGAESDSSTDHPVPCQCGSARCRLIAALVEKYDAEHEELGDEAELVEVEAEVDAARQLDEAIENEGWPMDASTGSAPVHEDGD